MSDTSNPFAQGFFFAGSDPANLKMREKIALAQMMQKRKTPTNLGEGIYSVGESIANALTSKSLMDADKAAQVAASKSTPADAGEITPLAPAPPITPQAGVPSSVTAAPIAPPATAAPIAPAQTAEQSIVPASPAVPAPPDVPGATRLSTPAQLNDFRLQNPLPRGLPPVPQAGAAPTTPMFRPPPGAVGRAPAGGEVTDNAAPASLDDRFGAAFPNRVPPVVAAGGDTPPLDARNDAAVALMNQQRPPPAPQPMPQAPAPAPGLGIQKAPPPGQPAAIPGYVPPALADPTEATIIKPSKRELQLQSTMNKNQGNPYWASGADAKELEVLRDERNKKQAFEDEKTKAALARTSKRMEQTEAGRMDQAQREAAVAETRQKLIDFGQQRAASGAGPVPQDVLGTPRSPQRSGVPTPDPMPPGSIPVQWAEAQQKKIMADQAALEAAKPTVRETLDILQQTRNHPAKDYSLGTLGGLGQKTAEGQGFVALNDQLKGKNLVVAYQALKGTGQIGEKEGENFSKAQARLTTTMNKTDYDKALDDMESSLRGSVERVERKLNQPVTAYQKTPNDPYAPDIGQIDNTWRDGKVRQYVGGDPHDKEKSWKIIR